jgi:hypothetical protein
VAQNNADRMQLFSLVVAAAQPDHFSYQVFCLRYSNILSPPPYYSSIHVYYLCQPPSNMDLLSVIASITAVLQLSEKFLKYLENVENDSEDRTRCVTRALYLHNLLNRLPVLLQVGNPVKPLYAAIGALSMENGPLDQYKQALEKLQTRITEGRGLMKSSEPTIWRFEEGEVTSILARIERLKTSIEIALQMHYR